MHRLIPARLASGRKVTTSRIIAPACRLSVDACSERGLSHWPRPYRSPRRIPRNGSSDPPASSERALEHSTGDRSEDRVGDPPDSKRLTHKKQYKTARNPHRQRQDAPNYRENRAASWNGRGYDRTVGELGRVYSLDRSFGQKSFWDWSR
jgi:hypothetical protein